MTLLDQDPLEEAQAQPTASGHHCEHGWCQVSEKWARHHALARDATGAMVVDEERLAALRNTVYPCKTCKPILFYRWAGKHMDPDHDPSNCQQCVESRTGPRKPAAAKPGFQRPPARRDVD